MACDVKVAFESRNNAPASDLMGEETVDLYLEYDKDLRRSIINQEFMVHYGNDPSRVSKCMVSLEVLLFCFSSLNHNDVFLLFLLLFILF